MKIGATGDLHLGAGAALGARPGDRLRDQEQVLDRIAETFHEAQVEAVLIAGDVFDRPRPTPEQQLVFARFVKRLEAEVGPTIAITGNAGHDIEAGDRPAALDVEHFHGALRVSRTPELLTLPNEIGEDAVFVATLPSVPVARLVATRNGSDRDDLHREAAALLIDTARGLRAQVPDGAACVLLGHWSVDTATTATGQDVGLFREPVLSCRELEALGFDAVVLGHIHKAQLLGSLAPDDELMPIFYVGSPMPLSFGEPGEHGVWILELGDHYPRAQFVPIESRPLVTLDVDITGEHETTGLAYLDFGHAANEVDLDGAIVRARYRATEEQARRVDHAALREGFAAVGVVRLFIQPDIVRETRARVEGVDEQLGEIDALRQWATANDLEDRLDQMEARTTRYLEELVA